MICHVQCFGIVWRGFTVFPLSLLNAEFIKGGRKDNFPKLQVRYKKGATPVLKLLDDNTVADTLAWVPSIRSTVYTHSVLVGVSFGGGEGLCPP